MSPEQLVTLHELGAVRDEVRTYMCENAGWRAEDRDLVWSHRLVAAKLSLLGGKSMTFAELTEQVRSTLAEAPSPLIGGLTPELIAEKICTPVA